MILSNSPAQLQAMPRPVLVTDNRTLQQAVKQWRSASALALDTEFMRTDTFYPRFALLQVSDGQTIWLIDPLKADDVAALREVLADPGVVKVLHSCSEDLEVLKITYDCLPEPLFDTQIVAAMIGHGFSLAYSKLVKKLLNVELDKHETRSDWLVRPLRDSQLSYAAEDVYYLLPVYQRLKEEIAQMGRQSWVDEEMSSLLSNTVNTPHFNQQYRRVKGAGQLDACGLAVLQTLAAWREVEARNRDKPRGHIVDDKSLLEMAQVKPQSQQDLFALEKLRYRTRKEYGEKLVALVGAVSRQPEDWPEPFPSTPSREMRQLVKTCRVWLKERAEELKIAPEILARRSDLEALAGTLEAGRPALPEALAQGWRKDVLGEDLLNFIQHTS